MPCGRTEDLKSRRATKACARCRKRKIKCDLKFPTCAACAQAGADCLGFDAIQGREKPRSTISFLENRVAELEIELAGLDSEENPDEEDGATIAVERLTTRLAMAIAEPWSSKHLTKEREKESVNFGSLTDPAYLSQSPLPKFSGSDAGSSKPPDISPASSNIVSVPRHVINIMLKNYCENYLPQYPAIEETALYEACERIYRDDNPSHFDHFSVAITLAISANTLIQHDEIRALRAAGEFWQTAVEHLGHVGRNNAWQRLQALQLLAHYGLLNPQVVNCSNCAAAATRLTIRLGLHRELPLTDQKALGADVLDARRRLFWTSFIMDAAFQTVLCRPFLWPYMEITAKFPESGAGVSLITGVWLLRQMETEITIRMYFPSISYEHGSFEGSFDAWYKSMHDCLEDWNKNVKSGLADTIELQLFRMHRPSPRYPRPTLEMKKRAVKAAITLIREYENMGRSGKFFYLWYAAHYLTELGVTLLDLIIDGLQDSINGPTCLDEFDIKVLLKTMKTFPFLLGKVSSRWSSARQQVVALQEISALVMHNLKRWSEGDTTVALSDNAMIREKLAHFMIFSPSPTLYDQSIYGILNPKPPLDQNSQSQISPFDRDPLGGAQHWLLDSGQTLPAHTFQGTTAISSQPFIPSWTLSNYTHSFENILPPDQWYTPYPHMTTNSSTGSAEVDLPWNLAGMDSDQIFAALLEGRDGNILST